MKKYSISVKTDKLKANEKGYADLEIILNKEEKKKEGETWELWQVGFVATKVPKGQNGEIIGNVSEFRNKETKEEIINSFGETETNGIDPDDVPF